MPKMNTIQKRKAWMHLQPFNWEGRYIEGFDDSRWQKSDIATQPDPDDHYDLPLKEEHRYDQS